MCHFANLAKNQNLATFWLDLGQICKNGWFSARADAWYSPNLESDDTATATTSLMNKYTSEESKMVM
jgi:hypothetical protein